MGTVVLSKKHSSRMQCQRGRVFNILDQFPLKNKTKKQFITMDPCAW